jgi:zinc D-Ala-D-Ala dipeptidase
MANPWNDIPIIECGEPMMPVPDAILCSDPHPYLALGAVYPEGVSPFFLRASVCQRLVAAQESLQAQDPGLRLKIYDGYRTLGIQQQMVDLTFKILAEKEGLAPDAVTPDQSTRLMAETLKYWSVPTDDPLRPPLHSTGGAVDLTIVDAKGRELDMGTAFDYPGDEAGTMFFANAKTPEGQGFHSRRMLLKNAMESAGFTNYQHEWWHYGYGDQNSALVERQRGRADAHAIYGRADLPKR